MEFLVTQLQAHGLSHKPPKAKQALASLNRAKVAAMQQRGLMDHDVLEQTKRYCQTESPRA